jgi:hypothetical protein
MSLSELICTYGNPLLTRETGSVSMALFASENREDIRIFYAASSGQSFVLNPPRFLALDCWRNPLVYFRAELNGISNPFRLVPADLGLETSLAA